MKRSNLVKFSVLALFASLVLFAFNLINKEEKEQTCPKCSNQPCKPAPKVDDSEYYFYQQLNAHPIAASFKQ